MAFDTCKSWMCNPFQVFRIALFFRKPLQVSALDPGKLAPSSLPHEITSGGPLLSLENSMRYVNGLMPFKNALTRGVTQCGTYQ